MRDLPTALRQHFDSRAPRNAHLLVTIWAVDRTDNEPQTIGFWTGADHRAFQIGQDTRTYYGAGAMLSVTPLTVEVGLSVRTMRVTFSKVAPEVMLAARGYETRRKRALVHVVDFDALTREQIAEPVQVFKGRCEALKMTRPPVSGGDATVEIAIQSAALELTRTLPLKKSDEALQARAPGDRLRRYADVSGSVETVWGVERAKAGE